MNKTPMEYSEYVYDAWLASADIPPVRLQRILEEFPSAEGCYEAFMRKDPELTGIIPERIYSTLVQNADKERLRWYSRQIDLHGIRVIHQEDPGFPDSLRFIDDAPSFLFYQGNIGSLDYSSIAVVGSRAATYSGQKASEKLAEDLSRRGIAIISGLACGIDAAAHRGCMKGDSPTIAITGCGLDRVYPSDNIRLRDEILQKGGLILSEYAPGVKPSGWHFPVRNRLIAGLSLALVLMEAKIRSGSMTSVQHALDQGKDVFVYPGDPASDKYEGNHQLLREGGIYFTSAEDILEDLHLLDKKSALGQNTQCAAERTDLSPEEKKVLSALEPGALGFEELLVRTGMDASALMGVITLLQIKGCVEALPGKNYQVKQ